MGCCLVALGAAISPRLAILVLWLFSERLTVAFESFWMGLAGFVLLPWTTLMYALAYAPTAEVTGIGWVLVGGGLLADLGSWIGGGREGRSAARRR